MRPLWIALIAIPVIVLAALLMRFGQEGVDRVDVQWDVDPPPRWGLYPGYRQGIPWKRGARYNIIAYTNDSPISTGTVTDLGMGLTYTPRTQAKSIEHDTPDADRLTLTLVNLDPKTGKPERQLFLNVERRGDTIFFAFPKD